MRTYYFKLHNIRIDEAPDSSKRFMMKSESIIEIYSKIIKNTIKVEMKTIFNTNNFLFPKFITY